MADIINRANPGTKNPAGLIRREWWLATGTFAEFLNHLIDEHGYEAKQLVGVVAKPWHWTPEFKKWMSRE